VSKVQLIDNLFDYMHDQHISYHQSIYDIVNNSKIPRKALLFKTFKLSILSPMLTKIILFIVQDDLQFQIKCGEALTALYEQAKLIYISFLPLMILVTSVQVLLTFAELIPGSPLSRAYSQHVIGVMTEQKFYRLSKNNEQKWLRNCNFLFHFFKSSCKGVTFVFSTSWIYMTIMAILSKQNEYNLFALCLNLIIILAWFHQALALTATGLFLFYLPISFINYKINELALMLNPAEIDTLICKYDEIVKVVNQISKVFNILIG